jgi:hypothetical protein
MSEAHGMQKTFTLCPGKKEEKKRLGIHNSKTNPLTLGL